MRKIRHLIEFFKSKVVIYISYFVTIDIVKQASLIITFTIKLNLRLIRVSQYLQSFELKIRHKSNKRNVISNALSRLLSANKDSLQSHYTKLNVLHAYVYIIILIKISNDFKTRVVEDYKSNLA